MVKKTTDTPIGLPGFELETHDEQRIESEFEDAPVDVQEKKISYPTNAEGGLYLLIKSGDRDDLYADATMGAARAAADACGYQPSRMDKSDFPTDKGDYYTLSIWFKHRA